MTQLIAHIRTYIHIHNKSKPPKQSHIHNRITNFTHTYSDTLIYKNHYKIMKMHTKPDFEQKIEPSRHEAFESHPLNLRQAGIGGADIVEAHEAVPETLVSHKLQVELLGVFEGQNGRVCRTIRCVFGVELESWDGAKGVPYGLLEVRREVEVGGGERKVESGPEGLERETVLELRADFC